MNIKSQTDINPRRIPQLTRNEQLELQNLLLKMNVECERIEKYKILMGQASDNVNILNEKIDEWKAKFNQKLKKIDLDMSLVDIDAETGKVSINNTTEFTKQLKPLEKAHGS